MWRQVLLKWKLTRNQPSQDTKIYHGRFCTDTENHLASSQNYRKPSGTPSDIWVLYMLSQCNASQSTSVTDLFLLLSSLRRLPRVTTSTSESNRRKFRIVMDFLGPLATLLLRTCAYCSSSSPRLPSCSPRTSGGSQLCLHFELLNSTAGPLKNPTQACSPFVYSMAPLYIHQPIIKRQHQEKHYPQYTPP